MLNSPLLFLCRSIPATYIHLTSSLIRCARATVATRIYHLLAGHAVCLYFQSHAHGQRRRGNWRGIQNIAPLFPLTWTETDVQVNAPVVGSPTGLCYGNITRIKERQGQNTRALSKWEQVIVLRESAISSPIQNNPWWRTKPLSVALCVSLEEGETPLLFIRLRIYPNVHFGSAVSAERHSFIVFRPVAAGWWCLLVGGKLVARNRSGLSFRATVLQYGGLVCVGSRGISVTKMRRRVREKLLWQDILFWA